MTTGRMHFIGVTTGGSRIMDLFPVWAGELGLEAEIVGRDVPIGADPDAYRGAVTEIRDTPAARGALVTTHKVGIARHAREAFAGLDTYARLLGEVSCIAKRPADDALVGFAKDPLTAGRSLAEMLGTDHWRSHPEAEALVLGAGGAGTAISVVLLDGEQAPARVTVTDVEPDRLEALAAVHAGRERGGRLVTATAGGGANDEALAGLPPGSLVVNATGMGKDVPGSPLSGAAGFPAGGVAWELNYRGPRPFLEQAREQAAARGLAVHDGWRYFLHGWSEHIAEVFGLTWTRDRFERLAAAAEPHRPG